MTVLCIGICGRCAGSNLKDLETYDILPLIDAQTFIRDEGGLRCEEYRPLLNYYVRKYLRK